MRILPPLFSNLAYSEIISSFSTFCSSDNRSCVSAQLLSHVWITETPWTVARQASLSMGFSKQEYWSGLPCLPPGDLPSPGIEPTSITSPALAGKSFTTSATWEALLKSVAHLLSWLSSNQAWFSYPCLAHSLAAMHVGFFCAALSPVAHPSQCNCAKVSL